LALTIRMHCDKLSLNACILKAGEEAEESGKNFLWDPDRTPRDAHTYYYAMRRLRAITIRNEMYIDNPYSFYEILLINNGYEPDCFMRVWCRELIEMYKEMKRNRFVK